MVNTLHVDLSVFEKIKNILKLTVKVAWIEFARIFLIALSASFFLIPAFVCWVKFAFVDLISIENPLLDTKGVFLLSKELASGKGRQIFLLLLSSVGNACAVGSVMLSVLLIINKFLPLKMVFYLSFVPLTVLVAMFFISKINLANIFFQSRRDKILQSRR